MSSIDERVVDMKFRGDSFLAGITTTLNRLADLRKSLDNLRGGSKVLDDVNAAGNRPTLQGLADSVSGLTSKFSALGIMAITTLQNITNRAISAGTALIHSLTLAPIQAGFGEYELKMGSIQTILSNTARFGTQLPEVNKNLDALNTYADKTIYSFGDMTKNIGLFTNAGIRVGDATSMIKGFSNEAAASGTNAQGAASAAYQLSQALSAGTIRLMDWRSLQNVGMGNKNMQLGIIDIANAMGTLKKAGVDSATVQKDFNGSLEKGWLSADVMSTYLKIMAGDMNEAQMKTLGLNDAQIKQFKIQQKNGEEAATKVRTWTQLIGTMREAVGSGWSETFGILIGDFNSATTLWTGVNDTLGAMIGKQADVRNKLLKDWSSMGGRDIAIKGLAAGFNALLAVIKPIKEAFREIFPAMTAKQLLALTVSFRNFMQSLMIGTGTAAKLKSTFAGVFAILGIAWEVIKKVADMFLTLFGNITYGSGSILDFTAKIGDWLVGLYKAIKAGDSLTNFFATLTMILSKPIEWIRQFIDYLGQFFSMIASGAKPADDVMAKLSKRFEPLGKMGAMLSAIWGRVLGVLGKVWDLFRPMGDKLAEAARNIGTGIVDALKKTDYSSVLDGINTGLFAMLVLSFKKFLGNFGKKTEGDSKGFISNLKSALAPITDIFGSLTSTLKTMQQSLKADILLKIAAAVGILTLSIVALSVIDSGALTKSLTAISVMFLQLGAALAIFNKISASGSFLKLPAAALSLILLATAIDVLTIAVARLGQLDWGTLTKGLVGVGGLLVGLALFTKIQETNKRAVSNGIGLMLLAIAIRLLVDAVSTLGGMDVGTILTGVGAIAGLLLVLGGFSRLSDPKGMLATGAALVLIGASMKIFASAVKDFGSMDLGTLAKGLGSMAVALFTIALAMKAMPMSSLLNAVALVVVAASLKILVGVLQDLGGMSVGDIAKSLITLALALGILAGAMYLMTAGIVGAVGMVIMAGALAILVPVIQQLAQLQWGEVGKGLAILTVALLTLGVVGGVVGLVSPLLFALGLGIIALGVGVAATGAGLLVLAAGLTALSAAVAVGSAAIVAFFASMLSLIPLAMQQVGLGILAFAGVIAAGGPAITAALVTVLMSLLAAINTTAPAIVATLMNLLALMLGALVRAVPMMVNAGMRLILGILQGVAANIGRIVQAATDVIVNFANALGRSLPRIIDAGVKLVIALVNGIANSIRSNSSQMESAGRNLGSAIVTGMVAGIKGAVGGVIDAAKGVASSAISAAKNLLGIHSPSRVFHEIGQFMMMGLGLGITRYGGLATDATEESGRDVINTMRKTISGMAEIIANNIDAQPTIAPVLDLTDVERNAKKIGGLIAAQKVPVQALTASDNAAFISARYGQTPDVSTEAAAVTAPVNKFEFNQYNTSPKALSLPELYRQTNNQISQMRGALTG